MSEGNDAIFRYLLLMNMTDAEPTFRGMLANICEDIEHPTLHEMVIVTVGTLMAMGAVPWPVIMMTITTLSRRNPDWLKEDALAILDGQNIMLPSPTKKDEIDIYAIRTLTKLTTSPEPAIVTTCYSVEHVWTRATKVLEKI